MVDAALDQLERGGQGEDRVVVLEGDDPTGRKGVSVPYPVDSVSDRDRRVTGSDEVRVQRVHGSIRVDGARRRHERLPSDLTAENALQGDLRSEEHTSELQSRS